MERAVLGVGAERRLTRSQVAERLGVSVGTVRNLERAGELKPTRENGVNLFDPRDRSPICAPRVSERDRPTERSAKRKGRSPANVSTCSPREGRCERSCEG